MARRSAVVWWTALAALAASKLPAQDPQAVAPGTRVRVTSKSRLVGTLVSTNAESLVLWVAGRDQTVPRSAVKRFEISQRPSRKDKGALIGACVGAVPGALFGWLMSSFCDGSGCVAGAFILGTAFGAAPGAAIGAAVASGEKWVEVPIDRARLSLGPARKGAGVALTVSF